MTLRVEHVIEHASLEQIVPAYLESSCTASSSVSCNQGQTSIVIQDSNQTTGSHKQSDLKRRIPYHWQDSLPRQGNPCNCVIYKARDADMSRKLRATIHLSTEVEPDSWNQDCLYSSVCYHGFHRYLLIFSRHRLSSFIITTFLARIVDTTKANSISSLQCAASCMLSSIDDAKTVIATFSTAASSARFPRSIRVELV